MRRKANIVDWGDTNSGPVHAQGVVHRDIKPDNCLVTEDNTLKLVDFGVSEMFERGSDMKLAKSAGSPAFMAPELCIIRKDGVAGKPADIWSMGVTLYCLRFGRVPFQKSNMLDLYEAIEHEEPDLSHDCTPELADLLRRLLEKDPDKRITMEDIRVGPGYYIVRTLLRCPIATSVGHSKRTRQARLGRRQLCRVHRGSH